VAGIMDGSEPSPSVKKNDDSGYQPPLLFSGGSTGGFTILNKEEKPYTNIQTDYTTE
jgi:hypothetical protein